MVRYDADSECVLWQTARTRTEKTGPSRDARNTITWIKCIWLTGTVNQFTICLDHCSWQWSDGIQNGGSILNAAVARLCHGEYVLQTGSVAHLWAFPIRCLSDWWHSLVHLPLFSPRPWFIRLVSVTWHWHCPLLLLWKLPAGTFTIIWSPDG